VQRSRGSVARVLTPEGAQFLQRAQSVLAEMRSAAAECGAVDGRRRFGSPPSVTCS
jgi:DNA-binding transcriptional LysR family regulator